MPRKGRSWCPSRWYVLRRVIVLYYLIVRFAFYKIFKISVNTSRLFQQISITRLDKIFRGCKNEFYYVAFLIPRGFKELTPQGRGGSQRSKYIILLYSRAPSEFSHTFFCFQKEGSGLEILKFQF